MEPHASFAHKAPPVDHVREDDGDHVEAPLDVDVDHLVPGVLMTQTLRRLYFFLLPVPVFCKTLQFGVHSSAVLMAYFKDKITKLTCFKAKIEPFYFLKIWKNRTKNRKVPNSAFICHQIRPKGLSLLMTGGLYWSHHRTDSLTLILGLTKSSTTSAFLILEIEPWFYSGVDLSNYIPHVICHERLKSSCFNIHTHFIILNLCSI